MHVEPPAITPSATPAPTDETQAMAARLDDVMAQAEIAANAQRDEESEISPAPPDRQEAQPPTTDSDEDDELEDDSEDEASAEPTADEAAPEPSATEESPTADTPTTSEAPKRSRRETMRLAEQAEQYQREAAEARQIAERAQAELNMTRASDQHVLTQLAEISGYTVESNGRTRYANLADKVTRGTANDQERREVAEMTQWHDLAKPIYRAAEREVTNAFAADWAALKDLDGVGDKGLTKLNQAATPIVGARELHAMAYAAGQAKGSAEAEATIAKLRAQLKSTRTAAVAHAPQPAVANGAAVPGNASFRDRAFNADGTLNDDFDKEVRAGKWLGVDLATHG